MALPKGYLPKQRDILIFHAEVRHSVDPVDDYVHVTKPGTQHQNLTLNLDEVVGIYARRWEPGDKVQCGEVVATCGDQVWVQLADGGMATYAATELQEVSYPPPAGLSPIEQTFVATPEPSK